jgi:spore germination cell wall hydrolase CwlJ-like protein
MANAIYYESRGEPLEGRRAVFDVIHHRMVDKGKSACAIIRERYQFSWVRNKPMLPMTYEMHEMLVEVRNTDRVLTNEKVKFFHSGKKPSWARKMFCRKIANHSFCAERKQTKEK